MTKPTAWKMNLSFVLRHPKSLKRVWVVLLLLCAIAVLRSPDPVFPSIERAKTTTELIHNNNNSSDSRDRSIATTGSKGQPSSGNSNVRCALNFFGLPRAFESLVLPSIVKNIVAFNPGCDYFVHYYHKTNEAEGRSGKGGVIDPTAVLLLRDAVHSEALRRGDETLPIVEFVHDKEEEFWIKYSDLIEKIRTTKVDGKYLYFPWAETTYRHPETTDNIVKMWHTIQSSFELMEKFASSNGITYDVVGMFRLDVVYVTPINIRDAPKPNNSNELVPATITNFGNFPVSDRMIYGPREAVKAWATQRFSRLDSHVAFMLKNDPGWGMQSEKFVYHALLPLIKNVTTIRPHPTICFFRARADETVWVSDCSNENPTIAAPSIKENMLSGNRTYHDVVQDAIGRPCSVVEPIPFSAFVLSLPCPKNVADEMVTEKKHEKDRVVVYSDTRMSIKLIKENIRGILNSAPSRVFLFWRRNSYIEKGA